MIKDVAFIDVGTTKIVLLTARMKAEAVITGLVSVPSRGIRKGQIIDMKELAGSIRDAIALYKREYGTFRFDYIFTAISGNSIVLFESLGTTGIGGRKISTKDMEVAINSAGSLYIPIDREILHIIPVEYIVDGVSGIKNPEGMKGYRLDVKVQIITILLTELENIKECFQNAGLEIGGFVFKPLALQKALLSEEEVEDGVLLIDIGGGTTEIAIFKNKRLLHFSTIPVGGNHITNDLAIGLKTTIQKAEEIKIKYGSAMIGSESKSSDSFYSYQEIEFLKDRPSVSIRHIDEIVYPRCEEIAHLIKRELSRVNEREFLRGAVVTGGTASLKGLDLLLESFLEMPVRIGIPGNFKTSTITSPSGTITSPSDSTSPERMNLPGLSVVAGLFEYFREESRDFKNRSFSIPLKDLYFDLENSSKKRR